MLDVREVETLENESVGLGVAVAKTELAKDLVDEDNKLTVALAGGNVDD
jgi:hypothetical protein